MKIPCSFRLEFQRSNYERGRSVSSVVYPEYPKTEFPETTRIRETDIKSDHCPIFKTAIHLSRETRDYIGIKPYAACSVKPNFRKRAFSRERSITFISRSDDRSMSRVALTFVQLGEIVGSGFARSASTRDEIFTTDQDGGNVGPGVLAVQRGCCCRAAKIDASASRHDADVDSPSREYTLYRKVDTRGIKKIASR